MNQPVSFVSRVVEPLQRFLQLEAASGIVLLTTTVIALVWANSTWGASYAQLWHGPAHFWINDGLMTLFFLVVGLEIRREIHDGSLRTLRLAALPLVAAAGGVIAPALIYLALSRDPALTPGWAIPTATDIAFAVGVLAVLGKRVPANLRVLLLALAIIDDIVAILVIAFFYSDGIAVAGMLIAVGGIVGVLVFQKLKVASPWLYVLPGAVVWYGMWKAGIHPTLAGVALGLLTPVVHVERVEPVLHPWVAYGIMPLFALANAGVTFSGLSFGTEIETALTTAIIVALTIGKPLGIFVASFVAVKLNLSALPEGVDWKGVLLVGCLGGIGFTMSIFIANLAFPGASLLATAKFSVLVGSALAGVLGLTVGWLTRRA